MQSAKQTLCDALRGMNALQITQALHLSDAVKDYESELISSKEKGKTHTVEITCGLGVTVGFTIDTKTKSIINRYTIC